MNKITQVYMNYKKQSYLSSKNNKGRTLLIDTFDGFLDKEKLHSGEVFKYQGMDELKLTINKLDIGYRDI